jgi:hypothetical protein
MCTVTLVGEAFQNSPFQAEEEGLTSGSHHLEGIGTKGNHLY